MKIKASASARRTVNKEPFVRLVKRDNSGLPVKLAVRTIAVIAALLVIFIFIKKVTDYSFHEIWELMKDGAMGTEYTKQALYKDMACLLIVGLALAPAFKMRFWNIGAQGQIVMGALMTALIMIKMSSVLSGGMLILVMLIMSLIGGGVWALIPAFFKVKLNANETLFTLMLNYIAIQLTASAVDQWKGRNSALGIINAMTGNGYLPEIFNNPFGFVILSAVILTVLMYIYMRKTKHGYEIAVVGESLRTARYAGINTAKVILRTMFLSGAIAGFCGFLYVAGIDHTVATGTGGSYGFTAIIVAWAAKFNPIAMAVIAFAIVFLQNGSTGISDTTTMLNDYTAYIVVGIFLFFLIGCEFFINYRMVYNSKIVAFKNRTIEKFNLRFPKIAECILKCKTKIKAFTDKLTEKVIEIKAKIIEKLSPVIDKISNFFKKIVNSAISIIKRNKPNKTVDVMYSANGKDEKNVEETK